MAEGIFISYRRDGGEIMAQLIHDRLVERGYSVFYDIESLSSGLFDTKLLEKIEACSDVILILPAQGLDRCIYEEDWVRKEIRHAIKCEKNIIPLMLRGFVFPPDLPDDIKAISRFNGIKMETMELFDARIERLISMLQSTPIKKVDHFERNRYSTGNTAEKPSLIANVCTMGAVDRDDPWPKGSYSPTVDLDVYNVVRFHIKLVKPITSAKTITHGFRIYDDRGALVHESESSLEMNAGYDTYSTGWIIRGTDGSYVKAGRYSAVFWMDDSCEYTINFKVTSKEQESVADFSSSYVSEPAPETKKGLTPAEENRMKTLKNYLAMPKLFRWFVLSFFALMFVALSVEGEGIWFAVALILYFVTLIRILVLTKQHVSNNLFVAILLVIFGAYFSIYVAVMTLACLFKRGSWKRELAELEKKAA